MEYCKNVYIKKCKCRGSVCVCVPLRTVMVLRSKIYQKCNRTKSYSGRFAWFLIYFATKQGPLPCTAHQAQIIEFGTPELSDLTTDAQVNSFYHCREVCNGLQDCALKEHWCF